MRNPSGGNRRRTWLTVYRFATIIMLTILVIIGVDLLGRPASMSVTASQATKVEQATSFLESAGFNNPVYLGVTLGAEGEYPTFRVEAIGGKSVDLWLRTTRNGGWEIQPVGIFHSVTSADDLARLANDAVYSWENMPPDIKPRTDGAYGAYEGRKYDFDLLAKYNPDKSYWDTPRNETGGWPRK